MHYYVLQMHQPTKCLLLLLHADALLHGAWTSREESPLFLSLSLQRSFSTFSMWPRSKAPRGEPPLCMATTAASKCVGGRRASSQSFSDAMRCAAHFTVGRPWAERRRNGGGWVGKGHSIKIAHNFQTIEATERLGHWGC